MHDRRKLILGVIIPIAAIALIFGAVASMSVYAITNCIQSCTIVESGGAKYRLTGEAYAAYLELWNIALPIHRIGFDSQYIDDRPYLINIDGPTSAVEDIVSEYNVIENGTKVTSDNRWTSFYGWIYKDDLIRFLNENSIDSLSSRSISVAPIGGYSLEEGVDVSGIPPQIPDPDMEQQFIAEGQMFIENEISRILLEESGVERFWFG